MMLQYITLHYDDLIAVLGYSPAKSNDDDAVTRKSLLCRCCKLSNLMYWSSRTVGIITVTCKITVIYGNLWFLHSCTTACESCMK